MMLSNLIRNTLAVSAVMLSASVLTPQVALAAIQDFRVHNRTGLTMLSLQVSESSNQYWGNDILPGFLESGGYTDIFADEGNPYCYYDIKAEFEYGAVLTYYNVNLCKVSDFYFR